jgi:hypothetical protein
MKRFIGIGLVTAALLAGCGGAPSGNQDTGTGTTANATAVTGADGAVTNPTLETSAGGTGDIAPDATAAANATAVSDAGATTTDATAQATPDAATSGGDAMANPTAAPADGTTSSGTTSGSTSNDTTSGTTSGSTAPAVGAYQQAELPELGMSFQVPEGWQQVSGENAWSPNGVDTPRIGVNSADLTADWRPSSFLPEGATIKSSQQTTINGQQAMIYLVENSDRTAETHVIVRSGEKAYDIYARAASLQELTAIQPVLNDIVGSVQLSGA